MKYYVLIIDGAAGWPLTQHDKKTCLELAHTPNLDVMAKESVMGLAQTVPEGMEPSSACACMSILGYDPKVYYGGRSAIEATSMGIPIEDGEIAFRCNLVAVRDEKMCSYSSDHIGSNEAQELITALNENLGNDEIHFYPGVSYRHICKIKGHKDTLSTTCTPPHDIPGKPVNEFLPRGPGGGFLRELMARSEIVLGKHPVNVARRARGDMPATMVWLFWGSNKAPAMPAFKQLYGLDSALTSGVDLLRGLALMTKIKVLNIKGVTDNLDNDYAAQAMGSLEALRTHDMVITHVEAPDEAAHAGSINDKIEAICKVDTEIISRLCSWSEYPVRVLIMPDHATPINIQTHVADPVPFMLFGTGFMANGARRFTEIEAKNTHLFVEKGYNIMGKLVV